MNLTARQEALYQALGNIDDAYLDEAICASRYHTPHLIKRLCAIAAVIAIIITCFALTPAKGKPLFTTTVHASDDMDTVFTMTATAVDEYIDSLPQTWSDKELFCIELYVDYPAERPFESLYAAVSYMGDLITDAYTGDHLVISYPKDEQTGLLCRIYGWAERIDVSTLNFNVLIFQSTGETEDTLLCSQPFKVYHSQISGQLVINQNAAGSGIREWTFCLMSTEQLVDWIVNDDTQHPFLLFSNADGWKDYIHNHYSSVLPVLSTREDAATIMLSKAKEIKTNDFTSKYATLAVLVQLLNEYPYNQYLCHDDYEWLDTALAPQSETQP